MVAYGVHSTARAGIMVKIAKQKPNDWRQYFGERGPATMSVILLAVRVVTVILLCLGCFYLYRDLMSDGALHPHDHHRHVKGHGHRPHRQKAPRHYWSPPTVPDSLQHADQDDPALIAHIRQSWLLAPVGEPLELSSPDRVDRSQAGQSACVDHLLRARQAGFYVEAGAANGETFSNTLYLERFRNWTGLLIEPNSDYFSELLTKNRRAYLVNACLSPTTRPMVLNFTVAKLMSSLTDYVDEEQLDVVKNPKRYSETIRVQCFPIYSILRAMDIRHIDYFSLDVSGPDLQVLRTLPLDLVDVEVFSLEYRVAKDKAASQDKKTAILDFMDDWGYYFAGKLMRLDLILQKGDPQKPDPICFPQRTDSF